MTEGLDSSSLCVKHNALLLYIFHNQKRGLKVRLQIIRVEKKWDSAGEQVQLGNAYDRRACPWSSTLNIA